MAIKLNPNHQVLWHSPTTMQIGTDARSVVLPMLSLEQERFIDALYFGVAPNQVAAVAKQAKLPAQQAQELLTKLRPLLQGEGDGADAVLANGALARGPQYPDSVWASLQFSTDGEAVLAQRAKRVVQLDSLDPAGLLTLLSLAGAGVGTIVTADISPVTEADAGANAYPHGLIGHSRVSAASLILQGTWPATRLVSAANLRPNQLDQLDAVIFLGQQVIDPKRYAPWAARGIAHLTVVFDANGLEVSPLIRPGLTACLNCAHLHKLDNQPHWGVVSSQLLTSAIRFDHTSSRLIGCGLAVQSVLHWLDALGGFGAGNSANHTDDSTGDSSGDSPAATGFRYRPGPDSSQLETVRWQQHPDCQCALVSAQLA